MVAVFHICFSLIIWYINADITYSHALKIHWILIKLYRFSFFLYLRMADQYVTYVLHKEAIIYLHQRQTGCAYEFANEKCLSSEVDLNKEIKKIRSK